ncbi:hypothetical protein ETAA1_57920 [Urbifossiella limnaea]|uniref:Uncharacterized protein n=2 Tax=Urbifossiella limnaea TaxID=2528023 RepID=A0A517Y217_9BACT|nr:hypothetical protein [Urbifossiella limnaea]QDU23784.1 hypothetical protein ETAA1_57920 [Urbifossiella limnaea]
MTARDAILLAVPVFEAHQRAGLADLRAGLEGVGIPRPLAAEVVDFLPLALARSMLDGMGVRFADHYVRRTADGRVIGTRPLADEPVFREGLAIACEVSCLGDAGFRAVVERSEEYRAVGRALDAGSRAEDLECHPPVVSAGHDDRRPFDDTSGGRQPRGRTWWRPWG